MLCASAARWNSRWMPNKPSWAPGGGGMGTPIDGQKEIGLPGLVSPYL